MRTGDRTSNPGIKTGLVIDPVLVAADRLRRLSPPVWGRSYLLATSRLTPESGGAQGYIRMLQIWTEIADSIFEAV